MYRAFAKGLKIVFNPLVRIRHAHGRRHMAAVYTTRRSYAKGRGAIYGKYLLRDRRHLMKPLYWEARDQFVSIVKWIGLHQTEEIKLIYAFWAGLIGKLLLSRSR